MRQVKYIVLRVVFCDFCQKYYHGESIAINVLVDNNTSKSVKKIKISGELTFGICFST